MPTRKLIVATNNRGKLREIEQLLAGCGFELLTPSDAGVDGWEVDETGSSFAENATLKAVDAMRRTGLLTLADDSGLEVDYLGGRPGIFSARYAGGDRTSTTLTDEERVQILLDEMRGVPEAQRSARFRCVVALAAPDGDVRMFDGVFEGRIAFEPRGENGFGYDPIFLLPERDVTSAELPEDEKNELSHRGKAVRAAGEYLRRMD